MPERPGYCPSCDRFIGVHDLCPYCDTPAGRLLPLRHLRLAALLIAVAGLGLVALFRHRLDTPTVALADLSPAWHGAHIRVHGVATAPPRRGRSRSGQPWLDLTLAERSCPPLEVVALGRTAEALAPLFDRSVLPETPLAVEAVGRLQWRAKKGPTLFVQTPADLILHGTPSE